MKRIEKRINKKTGEELQQYLHFRKRGYIQKNKIKNIPRKRKHKGEF